MGEEPRLGVFSIEEAKARLGELLERAAAGEEVVIATPEGRAVRLVRNVPDATAEPETEMVKRVAGRYKGQFTVADDCFDPMSEEELKLWYGDDDL